MREIHRDQRFVREAQDTLKVRASSCPDDAVDLLGGRFAACDELKIDDRNVRRRHSDRDTVELPIQLWQHQAHGLGRSRRGWNHRHRGGAGSVRILVQGIQCRLVASIAMDGSHESLVDADGPMKHGRNRGETIGGAGRAGNDIVSRRQAIVVDAEDDCLVGARGGCGDEDALRAVLEV